MTQPAFSHQSSEEPTPAQWMKLSYLYIDAQMWAEADDALQKAEQMLGQRHVMPALCRATMLIAQGEFAQALSQLKVLSKHHPESVMVQVHMAECCCFLDRPRQARRLLGRARAMFPSTEEDALIAALYAYWFDLQSVGQ